MRLLYLCGKQEKWTDRMVYKNQLNLSIKTKNLLFLCYSGTEIHIFRRHPVFSRCRLVSFIGEFQRYSVSETDFWYLPIIDDDSFNNHLQERFNHTWLNRANEASWVVNVSAKQLLYHYEVACLFGCSGICCYDCGKFFPYLLFNRNRRCPFLELMVYWVCT